MFPREQPWFLHGWEISRVVVHLLSWLRLCGNDFWCILLPCILHHCQVCCFCSLSLFDFFSFSIFPVHLRSYTLLLQRPVSILLCIAVCKALQTSLRITTVCLVSFSKLWILESIVQQAAWSTENPGVWKCNKQTCKPPAVTFCHSHRKQKLGFDLDWKVILHVKTTLHSFGYVDFSCLL